MISCGVATYRLLLLTVISSIDTNVMELVLDNRDSLVDPSSTAIPFAPHAQAARGKGKTLKRKD